MTSLITGAAAGAVVAVVVGSLLLVVGSAVVLVVGSAVVLVVGADVVVAASSSPPHAPRSRAAAKTMIPCLLMTPLVSSVGHLVGRQWRTPVIAKRSTPW
ncbi:MAG: hypothetical protein ACRD0R_04685 [Acidimicrobiales bacterium]